MSVDAIKNSLPEYARDLKLNLSSLMEDPSLTPQQRWGSLVVAALTARNGGLAEAVEVQAREHLGPEGLKAAKVAVAIMGMNNVYYRFTHVVSDQEYRAMPARLRMNAIARPGVDKRDFELWCLVASAINGCSACMDSHERVVREAGLTREAVQTAVRLGAVVHGIAVTLEAEAVSAAASAVAPQVSEVVAT